MTECLGTCIVSFTCLAIDIEGFLMLDDSQAYNSEQANSHKHDIFQVTPQAY